MSSRYTGGLVYNPPGGWSGLFSSGNYVSAASNAAFALGTGDFTVEAWVNPTSAYTTYNYVFGVAVTNGLVFYVTGGNLVVRAYNTGDLLSSATIPALNTWTHVAATRSGTTLRIFVNGVQTATTTNSTNFAQGGAYVGNDSTNAAPWYGYISNLRLVKGTAVYTSNFTPPTGALLPITNTSLLTCRYPTFIDGSANSFTITQTGSVSVSTANPFPTSATPNPALGVAGNGIYTLSQYAALKTANLWPAFDPFYKNVTLNLHGNAGAVLPFNTDASTNNFQVTQVGNTSPSNLTPFIANGYWSNLFGSNSGLTAPNNSAFKPATNAFTVECWIFSTSTAQQVIYGDTNSATDAGTFDLFINTSGFLASDYWTGSVAITTRTSTLSVPVNQWNHVVISRTGTTIYLGVNGVLQSFTGPSTFQSPATTYPTVGRLGAYASGSGFIGYISNFRYVNGTNLYSGSTYTVPTSPLTAIANTSLLTCQSNRFVDNSTNAFALTQNGTVAVNPLQPFTAPTGTSAYGSGFFDGSGDYLNAVSDAAFGYGTGDFTIEFWVYPTSSSGTQVYLDQRAGLITSAVPTIYTVSGTIYYYVSGSNRITGGAVATNQWSHISICRSGTSTKLFINGTQSGSTFTDTTTYITTPVRIGEGNDGAGAYPYSGYLSNFRIVKGTALYTTTFTPPTTPLTAISGTSLLTVQTNAPSQNNTFLDSSTNNFTITRFGNTTQGTFSPYGANWSNYFDGTGDYLTAGSSISLSGNFTVEGWVYRTTASGNGNYLFGLGNDTFSTGATFFVNSSTGYLRIYTGQAQLLGGTSAAVPLNTWTHVAFVRSSNTLRAYLNGVQVDSASWSATISGTAYINAELNGNPTATVYAGSAGYLSNIRINTTAVYTAAFTPSTAPLTAITGTALLTCADNSFIDDSTNNFTITRNGDTSVQRFSPFAPAQQATISYSGYFDGSGDYLSVADNTAFDFAAGDFTMEAWVNLSSASQEHMIASQWPGASNRGWVFTIDATVPQILFAYTTNGTTQINAIGTYTFAANIWYHVVACRSGANLRLFVNGAVITTHNISTSTIFNSTASVLVGAFQSGSTPLYGSMSNFRIVKGSAVYTAAFTPPTTPLTAISGTSLLTCQSTTFIDNSQNAFAITVAGNARPITTNPFGVTASSFAYSPSVIGGSGYFDGTGDYLTLATNNAFAFSGDFCIEFWAYKTSNTPGNYDVVFGTGDSGTGVNGYFVELSSTRGFLLAANNAVVLSYAMNPNTAAWNHYAVTRSGSTLRLFVGGVVVASTTYSTSLPSTVAVRVGGTDNTFFGYLSDVRVVKGSAVYTTTYTLPTAPLTAISNTQLLTNFTNAAIFDNSMMTDWETLGSAQLNTAYKKYGSGSISMLATGDYCRSTQPSTVGDINGGNFTIEFWVYFTSVAANRGLISKYGNTAENAGGLGYVLQFQQSIPSLRFVLGVGGGTDAVYDFAWSPAISTWYHVAVTRSGASARAFVNGSQIGSTTTVSTSDVASPNATQIGKTHTVAQYLLGYMDDIRITKGVARYTANFTPPTSQVQDQ